MSERAGGSPTIAIVGAGLAGAKTAEALRSEGFTGRIVLFGAEPHRPYERPPLSKDYLQGRADRDAVFVHPADWYPGHRIELRLADPVVAVDPAGHRLTTRRGDRLGYDRLLLSTGAAAIRLPVPGADLAGVRYLRTLDDSDALRSALRPETRVVIIGGGWIGLETAAAARTAGAPVTVLEQAELPLLRVLGPRLASVFADLHVEHGVRLHTGVTVASLGPAAGDVASAYHPLLGRRLRVEHWANALHQPVVAARTMLDQPAVYDRLPYFYTDQFELGMEFTGHPDPDDRILLRGDPGAREFIAFWLREGRLTAAMNVNVWDVGEPLRELIRTGRAVDEALLADPDVPLGQLLGAA